MFLIQIKQWSYNIATTCPVDALCIDANNALMTMSASPNFLTCTVLKSFQNIRYHSSHAISSIFFINHLIVVVVMPNWNRDCGLVFVFKVGQQKLTKFFGSKERDSKFNRIVLSRVNFEILTLICLYILKTTDVCF